MFKGFDSCKHWFFTIFLDTSGPLCRTLYPKKSQPYLKHIYLYATLAGKIRNPEKHSFLQVCLESNFLINFELKQTLTWIFIFYRHGALDTVKDIAYAKGPVHFPKHGFAICVGLRIEGKTFSYDEYKKANRGTVSTRKPMPTREKSI